MTKEEEDKKALEELTEAVTEKTVEAVMKKLEEAKPLRKDIFGGSDKDIATKEVAEHKEKAAEYLRKLVRHEDTKALSAGTSTSGAELVPTYVSDQIITVAQKYGLVRSKARKWPMQGINENIPTLSTLTAYRLNSDTSKVTSSQSTSGSVNLRAKTVGVLIPISKTLLMNSTANLVEAINFLAGKAIAKLEDKWGLLGLGSGEGVFQNASVPVVTLTSTNTTYAKAVAEDLLSMLDSTDENFIGDNASWVMSLSVLNNFRRLRSVVGSDKQGFLFQGFGGQIPATMWDIPYDTNSMMPKNSDSSQAGQKFLAYVDWENVIHGDAMQYTMEISDQATVTDTDGSTLINLFEQNMVALKVWGQVDIELSNPDKAFAVLKTAAS